ATLFHNARVQRADVIRATDDTARAILTAVDTEIAVATATLRALALSPRLAERDWRGFHAEAASLLERMPGWANIVLSTPTAGQIVNARLPYGAELPTRVAPNSVAAVAGAGKPGVGNLVVGAVVQERAFAVYVPVMRDGQVAYVLSAPIRPSVMLDVLNRQRIDEPAVAVILDAARTVVARSRRHDETVGRTPSNDLLELVSKGPDGSGTITTTLEGVPVYTMYRRSDTTGWIVAIGRPTSELDAPVRRASLALGGSIVLSVVLGLLAALLAARSIVRPMRELEAIAQALARGQRPVEPRTALPEVRQAARALIEGQAERERLLNLERDARRAAEAASRAKDEFLAMLGHELRNPVAAISSASQILDAVRDERSPMAAEARAIIGRQARQLGRMTDDLLDAGRVMLGKIELQRMPVELAGLVERVVATFRSTGRLAGRRVTTTADAVWIDGDASRIEQVVGNLLGNAIKFTSDGQSIQVRAGREGPHAVLVVADDGAGIEAPLLPLVFDLFVQGAQSGDRLRGGLGIGLALVRRLVELHGGSVDGHSEGTGRGSTFTVRLPAIEPQAAPPTPPTRPAPARRRIVIVEDNDDARTSLRLLLDMSGHDVQAAADGPAGLDLILRERPDVALVDIGLPGMDGCRVAEEVRSRIGNTVVLVAMTGYGPPEEVQRGMAAGFDRSLVKPVDPEVLAAILGR
ncbi:MAG TPA: ATP-binding protein, partial [Casimicrobiaceae bacterium]|nr:ATP-binding protein [Casimicrobiaceae bacterium]